MKLSSLSTIWHPFTQHGLELEMAEIARAEGAWLETAEGDRILDAISSWWVVTHGHRHPKIIAAIKDQSEKLDQVIFAGFTHEPAETLALRLQRLAPAGLSHVFFSDSGSTSVEVALKMALGYWRNRGEKRSQIIALEHAYHGDTIGTMSAGARGAFNTAYEPLLFDVARISYPQAGSEQASIDALEAICARRDAAALIVEPLILGAGGMLMYSADALRALHDVAAKYGVVFIADEVMTGFGRTGTMFACEQAGIAPDILCIAKGLTGGSLPLAATLCGDRIFDAHYSQDRAKTFFHSSSYTANPICCAAANANLDIWATEPVHERVEALSRAQARRLEPFRADQRFANVRQLGTITALELHGGDGSYLANIALRLRSFFLTRGILLRPLGSTIYVLPPYCITPAELDLVYQAIFSAADEVPQ